MEPLCSTRAVKVLKHLRRTVPATISQASLDELGQLPPSVLAGLRATANLAEVTADPHLREWLAASPVPAPRVAPSGPLFSGTLIFAQLIFQEPGQPQSTVRIADIETAVDYMTIAIITIQRYTSQYGSSNVNVFPDVIPFTADLSGDSFTQSQFEGWVDQCAQIARSDGRVINPCIVILHNRSLPGSPTFTDNANPYHSVTGDGTPYCYCLVFGEGLSVADNNHTVNRVPHEKVYAHILSHEVTEMLVDPKADDSNPEVCDPCAGNCSNIWFDLFDQNGVFVGGIANTPPAGGYAFFINPIVSSNAALNNGCLADASQLQTACVYPPPFVRGELLSYADDGTPGNVSAPALVGFSDWQEFPILFAGQDVTGANRIYAVNSAGQLLSYSDSGTYGNVSDPVVVGFGGWLGFKFLFAGQDATGANRIYAVNSAGQLLSYSDDAAPGNVSDPVVVGFGGWLGFKFLFAGQDATGANRIYAVNSAGQLLSYSDDAAPGNVSDPVIVGFDDWLDFKILFAGRNNPGQNRIYAVPG
jgi:hypothetical protein